MARGAVILVVILIVGTIAVFVGKTTHTIPEGFVGVYYRGGRLLDTYTNPGYHVMIPFFTSYELVQVSMQTDKVESLECGTSGGALFDKIEVVNQLDKEHVVDVIKKYGIEYDQTWIFERLGHELNQFCSSHTLQEILVENFSDLDECLQTQLESVLDEWAPGIKIISIRVTKPSVPEVVRKNYEEMESLRAQLKTEEESQRVSIAEAETEKNRALIERQSLKTMKEIEAGQVIASADTKLEIAISEQLRKSQTARAVVDSEFYQEIQQIEALDSLLTDEYLLLEAKLALLQNAEIIIGSKIPAVQMGVQTRDSNQIKK